MLFIILLLILLASLVTIVLWRCLSQVKSNLYPTLHFRCKNSSYSTVVINKIRSDIGKYRPPFWYHPLLGAIGFGVDLNIKYEREIFTHKDGSIVDVDWYPYNPSKVLLDLNTNQVKICIHFCGVGGSSDTVSLILLPFVIILTLTKRFKKYF